MAVLYNTDGLILYPPTPLGAYMANISVRHTVADGAASFVWAMRNPALSPRTVYIRNVRGRVYFDGTAVAAGNSGYEFSRFTNADPTTGTTIPRVRKRTSYPISVVADANIQQKSGILTLSGISNIEVLNVMRLPLSVTGVLAQFDFDLIVAGLMGEALELAPGEGFGIRTVATAAIGLGIAGGIEWDER